MKNKNGFTLVELLSVVAILSILVIVALPNVLGMFNDAKEKSFITECKQIYKVGQQQFINDSLFETNERTYARCDGCTQKELQLSGRTTIDYYIKFDKSGKVVTYYATDGTYQFVYTGEELLITDITTVDQVAKLEDGLIIHIAPDGVEQKHYFCEITSKIEDEYDYQDDWSVLSKEYFEYEEGMTWNEFINSDYNMKDGQKIFSNSYSLAGARFLSPDTFYDMDFFTCVTHIDDTTDGCYLTYHYVSSLDTVIQDRSQGCYGNIVWVR